MTRISAYLKMSRLSNLPTVWTNILAAAVISQSELPEITLYVALSLFYIAGMLLNDALDASFDQQHRQERPIPKGVVSSIEVFWSSTFVLIVANAILWWRAFSQQSYPVIVGGLALSGAICAYNIWHKKYSWSFLWMALCRISVYGITFFWLTSSFVLPSTIIIFALGLGSYILGITFLASKEEKTDRPPILGVIFLTLPILFGLGYVQSTLAVVSLLLLLVAVGCAIWIAYSKNIPTVYAILILLSGICLWDAFLIACFTQDISLWYTAMGCFFLTALGQKFIRGS